MTAPEWIITYTGIDGRLTTVPVRTKAEGWPQFYEARRMDPKACLYALRQEGFV